MIVRNVDRIAADRIQEIGHPPETIESIGLDLDHGTETGIGIGTEGSIVVDRDHYLGIPGTREDHTGVDRVQLQEIAEDVPKSRETGCC